MRFKITLSLLAILLSLLAYIFYIEPASEESTDFNAKNILEELAVGIDYLSIRNSTTGQNITFELKNNRWTLSEPYEWPANEFAVQKILTQLRFLERITSFETQIANTAGVSLSDYGLSPPALSIRFGHEGERYNLGIGKVTDFGNNLYILSVDKKQVHVVDRSLLDSLSVDLDELRSPRLFEAAIFEVSSWSIQVRDDVRNLRAWFSRNGDNWVFETPIRARADSASVNTLLNRCLNLEAESIVTSNPSDLSPYGLQNAPYRIAIEFGDHREVLEIGSLISENSEYRYAKKENQSTIFRMRIDFLDLIENAQTKLRQRRIFELDATKATTVTITRRDEAPLTLQKLENDSWEIVIRDEDQGIQTLKGDAKTIEEMLLWLDQLKAVPDSGFVNDAPSAPDLESYGLEVPEFSITITSNNRHEGTQTLETPVSTTLLIGDRLPQDRHESFVKIENKDFVYSVYNDIFTRIAPEPELYKDRRIIELPEGSRITNLVIERISDGAQLASYTFDGNAQPTPEAQALVQAFANLRAKSFNTNGFTSTVEIAGRHKPWAYTVTATINRNGADTKDADTSVLYVSETTGGPVLWGGILDRNLSFRFEIEFIDAFSNVVFDRTVRARPTEPFSEKPLPDSRLSESATSTIETTDAETKPAESQEEN